MEMKIKSRKLGRTITFSRPGSCFIFVDLNGRPGHLGCQICIGGGTVGSALAYYGDDQAEFDDTCRSWYREHLQGGCVADPLGEDPLGEAYAASIPGLNTSDGFGRIWVAPLPILK